MIDADGGFVPPPPRRWSWFGLAVELSKIPVGITYGAVAVADALHNAVGEIHTDLVAHYNWKRNQEAFRLAVTADLEMIREG